MWRLGAVRAASLRLIPRSSRGFPSRGRYPAFPSLSQPSQYRRLRECSAIYEKEPHGTHPSFSTTAGVSEVAVSESAGAVSEQKLTPQFSDAVQSLRIGELVRSYRIYGHLVAAVDPLSFYLEDDTIVPYRHRVELEVSTYGFTTADLKESFYVGDTVSGPSVQSLSEIVERLRKTYCGPIGYEYTHTPHVKERRWLQYQTEVDWANDDYLTRDEHQSLYHQILKSEMFERFLGSNFPSTKRFGLEGAEVLVPALNRLVDSALKKGFSNAIIGTAHRGRLNIMHNVLGMEYSDIFSMFLGQLDAQDQYALELFKWLDKQRDGLLRLSEIVARKDLVLRALGNEVDLYDEKELTAAFASVADENDQVSLQEFLTVMNRLVSRDYSAGDVKYHLGAQCDRHSGDSGDGNSLHIQLAANPSHLEAVCPVVAGMTMATQDELRIRHREFYPSHVQTSSEAAEERSDMAMLVARAQPALNMYSSHREKTQLQHTARNRALGILVHGDAGFCGQGVVAETMCLSELEDYHCGGIIHIVVNNQIGFTTPATHLHSSTYPTDIAKTLGAPILHVNGNEVQAVARAIDIAFEFREQFQRDVVVDLWCYRRLGHNEQDNPELTQPLQYQSISRTQPVRELYESRLISQGHLTPELVDQAKEQLEREFKDGLRLATERKRGLANLNASTTPESEETDIPPEIARVAEEVTNVVAHAPVEFVPLLTGVGVDTLSTIGHFMCEIPDGFHAHAFITKMMAKRRADITRGSKIDWATAEALALGSLIHQGVHVRLSGQDTQRGTFNQRHSVIHDQENGTAYKPLNHAGIRTSHEAFFDVCNSPLSEAGVFGFEYGYSLVKHGLVLWEAQFGDFANVAQFMIDTFLANGESKWDQQSSLVLLLPHGLDGQGPDHSSCRLERFLQLAAQDFEQPSSSRLLSSTAYDHMEWERSTNLIVVNCTTPAQYFHVLRRQALREFKKPLVIATPKYLLHHKGCFSSLDEMSGVTTFRRVIPDEYDPIVECPQKVRRIILCSGKVYYNLKYARSSRGCEDVALIRIEQLSPLPTDLIFDEIANYPNAEVIWCQEEPGNMAAWMYVQPRLNVLLEDLGRPPVKLVSRAPAASPAHASYEVHRLEVLSLVNKALGTGT